MNAKLGMDTGVGHEVARMVQHLSGSLELIEQQVGAARLMSLNPLGFGLLPGAPVLAPASIAMGAQVTMELANVQQNLHYLAQKLSQNATQQDQVSGSLHTADPGWFAPPPTAQKPDEIGLWEQELELLKGAWNLISWADWGLGIITGTIEAVAHWWKTGVPKWVKTTFDVVARVGKVLPWIGTPLGLVNTVRDWDNDNVWGNARNIIGNVIDVASIVGIFFPPVGIIATIVGVLWDVFDFIWDGVETDWTFS